MNTMLNVEETKAIRSSLSKCLKAYSKQKDGAPQKKWLKRQIGAYNLALDLDEQARITKKYSEHDIGEAIITFEQLILSCEKYTTRFDKGSAQISLIERRLAAFRRALQLLDQKLEQTYGEES